MNSADPHFEPRPDRVLGGNWSVQVTWRSGKTEAVTGFKTQYEALEWIDKKSANWVADKIMNDPEV
jgi:hypothetical protein